MSSYGNIPVNAFYGDIPVEGWLNGVKVFGGGTPPGPVIQPRSYIELLDGTVIYFDLNNTPGANFATSYTYIIVNGTAYVKSNIKTIVFGQDYQFSGAFGEYFLRRLPELVNLDINGLYGVTSFNDNAFVELDKLKTLDIRALRNLSSLPLNFIYSNKILEEIIIDNDTFSRVSTIANNHLYNIPLLKSYNFSSYNNVASVGNNFYANNRTTTELDISPMINLTTVGLYFFALTQTGQNQITKINFGSVGEYGINIASSSFRAIQNISTNIRIHKTQALADLWLSKIGINAIGNWQVIITG